MHTRTHAGDEPTPPHAQPRLLAALRRRMATRYPLRDLTLPQPAAAYTVTLPANPDDPLDRFAAATSRRSAPTTAIQGEPGTMSAKQHDAVAYAASQARSAVASGTHMPYWSLLWPSGQALAEALLAAPERARGARTLELGCGLGLTATAALDVGATLWAADCFPEALLFCRYNALRNTARVPYPLPLDWRTTAGRDACVALAPFDLLLAADVLYEQENLDPLLRLVPRLLASGGEFWLAEPGRRVSLAFVAAALARGWLDDTTVYERPWPPEGETVRVSVHRFRLPV